MIEVEYDNPSVEVIVPRATTPMAARKRQRSEDEEEDQHTCVWTTIAMDDDSVVGLLLQRWWCSLSPVTPVKHVAFVSAEVNTMIINNPNTAIMYDSERLYSTHDLDATPLLVFYTRPLLGCDIHVLGALLARDAKPKLQLKDLHQHEDVRVLDAMPLVRNQGVQEKRAGEWWWWRMPTDMWTDMFGRMPGGDPSEHVAYRRSLMCAFWKHRDNHAFESEGGHGDCILRALHERFAFFDMWTDEGRDVDVAGFWGLYLVCAQDMQLWDPWRHWERRLLEFRVRQYLCGERHFLTFLMHNDRLFKEEQHQQIHDDDDDDDDDAHQYERQCEDALSRGMFVPYASEDVDEREIQLYRARHPRGCVPKLWYRVRASDAGPSVVGNPAYDVENNCVFVTHREFPVWAWHQIETRTWNHNMKYWRFCLRFRDEPGLPRQPLLKLPSHIRWMIGEGLYDALDALQLTREGGAPAASFPLSEGRNYSQQQQYGIVRLGSNNGSASESLMELVRTRFPPCMAQHVWEAFVNRRHPENFSRLSLSMFLLSAGYSVQDVDNILFTLYGADAALVAKRYDGVWNEGNYKRENGGNVKGLKRSVLDTRKTSPYGCESLVTLGAAGKFHGCPFAKRNTTTVTGAHQPQIISLLQWSGCAEQDIEDIMGPSQFPQQKCERLLAKRNPAVADPDAAPIAMKHPNHFFRCAGK